MKKQFSSQIKLLFLQKLSIFLVLFFYPFTIAFATIYHTKSWNDLNLMGSFFNIPKVQYILANQVRFNITPDQYEQYIILGGLGYQCLPRVSFWLGGRLNTHNNFNDTNPESRIWEQVFWDIVNNNQFLFTCRSRLEERKRTGEHQWSDRFRQQWVVKFKNTILNEYTPVIYDEVFLNLTRPIWVTEHTFGQNRAFLGMDISTSKQSYLEIGYLNQYSFHNTDVMNNIIYLSFFVNT